MEGRTLRPLGVGEIVDASINLCFRNFVALAKIAAVVAIPMGVIIFLLDQIAFAPPDRGDSSDLGFAYVGEYEQRVDYSAFQAISIIETLLAVLAFLFVIGASFRAVSDLYIGKGDVSASESVRFAASRIHSMVWVGFLSSLGVIAATFAFVLPGIWLFAAWCVAIPALLAESVKGSKALGRSFNLVRDNWWRTFGALLVGLIFIGLFQFLLQVGAASLTNLTDESRNLSLVISDGAQVLALIITGPLQAAIIAVIYYDLRVRKEAFDVQLLAHQRESAGTGDPPSAAPSPPGAPPPPPPPPSTPSGW